MFGPFDPYLAVFLTGLVVSYLLTPLVGRWAVRLGAIDLPNERRPHRKPTPRGGGLAIILGVQAASVAAFAIPWPPLNGGLSPDSWAYFSMASLILLVTGILDDCRGLPPLVKLAGQAGAALVIFLSGTRFGTLLGYKLPVPLDGLLVVLWIVAIINALNLIDGLDGLASGLAIISALGLCGIFLLQNLAGNALMLVALIGACLGFLRYNFHPASIFLGDTGSMFLGFMLGVISLRTLTKSTFMLSLAIPVMVLGVPIYDEVLAVWRRSVRRWLQGSAHSGVMQPDLDHLHHRLLKAGLSTRRAGTLLFVLNAALVVCGVLVTAFESQAAGIFLIGLLGVAYVLLRHLAVIELRDTGAVLLTGLRRPTHATAQALAFPVWDMFCLSGAAAVAMWSLDSSRLQFWRSWFLDLPVWVTPTFSVLALSRMYLTVWSRARVRDLLTLLFILQGGLLLSLGIVLLIYPGRPAQGLLTALIVGGLSHPPIVALRVIYRAVEDLVTYFRSKSERPGGERVVLYGAGGRCQLFLKERAFKDSKSFDAREIIGLLDDEPGLHSQWVYGYPVLGGAASLPQLAARHRIGGVIITAALPPQARSTIRELALRHGLHLTEWHFEETELASQVAGPDQPELSPLEASKCPPANPATPETATAGARAFPGAA